MPSYSSNLMFLVNPFCTPPHTLEGGFNPTPCIPLTSLISILENSSVLLVNFFDPPREGQQTDNFFPKIIVNPPLAKGGGGWCLFVLVLIRASPSYRQTYRTTIPSKESYAATAPLLVLMELYPFLLSNSVQGHVVAKPVEMGSK